jgi:RimJ/RimL family protein N-acetyltransferase
MAVFPSRDRAALIEHWQRNLAREDNVSRTVLVNGSVAGHVVSWESDGRRWVGYWIGREFWGQGVATSALSQFCDLVPARPLYAHVAASNVASARVLEKNGFVRSTEPPHTADDGVEELLYVLH